MILIVRGHINAEASNMTLKGKWTIFESGSATQLPPPPPLIRHCIHLVYVFPLYFVCQRRVMGQRSVGGPGSPNVGFQLLLAFPYRITATAIKVIGPRIRCFNDSAPIFISRIIPLTSCRSVNVHPISAEDNASPVSRQHLRLIRADCSVIWCSAISGV